MIRNVSYSGAVAGADTGADAVGGIAGRVSGGSIQNAWNAGTVSGGGAVGGIVGLATESAVIQNVCNTGAIKGTVDQIGGIAGYIDNSRLQNAWNTGEVRGRSSFGGIVGLANGGSIRHAVWKSGTVTEVSSGAFIARAVGESSNATALEDIAERSEADMKLAATYTDWKDENGNAIVATEGGKGTPWRIYEGHTMPLLTALMKGTKRLEKTYDGKTFGDGDAHILSDTPLQKNVGTYDARGIYSDAFGYDLIGSTYRIAPRVLTLSGVASQTKTYDGNTNADATQFSATLNNVVAGEESLVTATASGAAYNSKDVAAANTVNYTGVALGGAGAGNYRIAATAQGTGTISQRTLTLAAVAGQTFDKVYDGTTNAAADALKKGGNYILSNFADGEGAGITVTGTGSYADKNVGTRAVNYTGLTLTGSGAGNYRLNTATLAGTGAITHRTLTLIAAPQSIVQGETLPSFTGHAEGFANGENESVFGADGITFDAAVTNTDTPGSYGITGRIGSTSDGVLGNYRITQAAGNATALTIHAAALPGGLLAALVQDSVPRFDFGFGDSVYLYGSPRPIPAAALGIYRFSPARDLLIEGRRLD